MASKTLAILRWVLRFMALSSHTGLVAAQSMQTFGHFGQAGSFIWVDPATGRSAAFLGAKPFSQIHKRLWPLLNQQIAAL